MCYGQSHHPHMTFILHFIHVNILCTHISTLTYHALTPIQCDVPIHMQCNAPLHVISCNMYNECYMDNIIHTTHRVLWTITSPAYDFHTTFHSCQYIMHAYININIHHVILCSSNDTHIIKPCNGHLHI